MRHIIGLLLFCFLATVACSSQAFSTLVNFGGGTNGIYPNGTLVLGSDGNLYGTTSNGGDNSVGTIFEVTPDGVLNTLYSFSYSGGNEPFTGLMQANDGNFYGTTSQGGGYDVGIVYRMTPGGIVTKIHSFAGWDGVPPSGTLILATDGYLYGVASYGGTDTIGGTVYKISLQGALTVVHSFCPNRDCSEGQAPRGTLVQASDGNFYGTTSAGGPYCAGNGGCGTVFKLTPDGTLTTLHYFNQSDGAFPYAGLVLANDGNFYGTTTLGGAQNYGTVFKITPDGTFTSLHSFNNTDGRLPYGPLVQASDGYFYGATYQGGLYCQLGCGTVFRITPQGGFTSLHSFDNSDGNLSYAGMLESTDGILYGTTSSGGTNYSGTLFRLVLYAGLSVAKSGMGTVSGGDGKIYCGTMCSYTYNWGAQETLGAVPAPGYTFAGWTGCDNMDGSYCSVTMTSAKNVTATFAPGNVTLTSLTFKPSYVKGGRLSAGTLTLSAAAPPGGVTVALSSDHPGVAHPPAFVFVPGNASSVQFAVNTLPVKSNTTVTITATAGGSQVSGTLMVGTTSLPPSLK